MLHRITTLSDPLIALIKDDPVRPEILPEFRVTDWATMFVLLDQYQKPQSVVCVAFKDSVPKNIEELARSNSTKPHAAIFYTIWSYAPGAGRRLITEARTWIMENIGEITEFVTLSPPTEMARQFHLRNGAGILRVNTDTVNYIYQ